MCCSTSFPLFALLNSAIIFMLFTLRSCVKLIHIKNETWCFFFVLFNQQTQSLFTNTMFFSFYVLSHMHLQIRCASSNDFSVWWSLYSVYFDLSTLVSSLPFLKSLLASCRSFLPCSTHTYTPFSNTIMNKMQWLKSKNVYNVTTDWWKLVKKKQDEMEKMSCAVTYNGEGMVEAGIGSEKFLRIRILEILKETPFFGPSS